MVQRSGRLWGAPSQGIAPGRARMLYSFDDYTLDADHYELRQAGRLVPIEPRVLDVLSYLVQHPGRTVTTEELKEQLYPHQVGTDDRLTNAVAQARKVLHDTGQTQRYIQTVRRRGYRFVAPVTVRAACSSGPAGCSRPGHAAAASHAHPGPGQRRVPSGRMPVSVAVRRNASAPTYPTVGGDHSRGAEPPRVGRPKTSGGR